MNHFLRFAIFPLANALFTILALIFCAKKKKASKKLKGNSADTFDQHAPVKREARRADEIKVRKSVPAGRDDYKTFNKRNMPESDFDKTMSGINQQ